MQRLGPAAALHQRGRLDLRADRARAAGARPDGRLQVLPARGARGDPTSTRVRSQGYAFQVELTYRAVQAGFRVVEVPIVFRDRERGPEQDVLADRRRGDVAGAAPALQVAPAGADAEGMDASAYAFAHGVRHTRATLRAWQRTPRPRARPAGSRARRWPPAGCWSACWWSPRSTTATSRSSALQPPVRGRRHLRDVLQHPAQQPARARPARDGLRGRASSPAARCRCRPSSHTGISRWVHEHGGRIAIAFVVGATAFSLSAQAYVIGHTLAGVSHFLRVSPGAAAAGRAAARDPGADRAVPAAGGVDHRQPPGRVGAAAGGDLRDGRDRAPGARASRRSIEVYVSPHLFTALTHIHPPIVRTSEGWTRHGAAERVAGRPARRALAAPPAVPRSAVFRLVAVLAAQQHGTSTHDRRAITRPMRHDRSSR